MSNRDFSQIRVGTVVGFDEPLMPQGELKVVAAGHISVLVVASDGREFSFGTYSWNRHGGHIIRQPE